jgi:hypothetical protein
MFKRLRNFIRSTLNAMEGKELVPTVMGCIWLMSGITCLTAAKICEFGPLKDAYADSALDRRTDRKSKTKSSLVHTNRDLENGGYRNLALGILMVGYGGGSFFRRRRKAKAAFSSATKGTAAKVWRGVSVNAHGRDIASSHL